LLHQIGYEEKKCMHAHARHHQQKYLSNPSTCELQEPCALCGQTPCDWISCGE